MSRASSAQINYRSLLYSTIKERSFSFTLGIIVVLLLTSVGLSIALPYVRPLLTKATSKETVQKKVKKTTTKKEVRTYTVKQGDQLYLIAQELYGSGLNMSDIMQANNITNPDLIEVGQKLIIPDVKPKFPTVGTITESAAKTEKVTNEEDRYVVKTGDDLAKIALQVYGDSYAWKKIADANGITNADQLEVGKILIIPR